MRWLQALRAAPVITAFAGWTAATPTLAASEAFSFVGNANNLTVLTLPVPGTDYSLTIGSLRLNDAVTNETTFPGYSISIGDHLTGQLTLNQPISVPSGSELQFFGFSLGALSSFVGNVLYAGTFSILNQGMPVVPGGAFVLASGSSIEMLVAGFSINQPFSGFTFDSIQFDVAITNIFDSTNTTPIGAAPVFGGERFLKFQVASPVPEPSPLGLLLVGGLAVGLVIRGRGKQSFCGPNVRAKLTAEVCVAWPRKENSTPALERPSNACRSGSA